VTRMLFAFAAAALVVAPASGHHSFAAYYHEEQTIALEGEIVEFEYRAPHAWVHLMAPDTKGQLRRFGAEWANPNRLSRDGITKDTLKAGDRVIINGSPGRPGSEFKVHLKRIERPADGWQWSGRRN
jgi:hypothetical protein